MEVFRDLIVTATPDQMAAVAADIEKGTAEGWSLDRESMEGSRRNTPPNKLVAFYHFRHLAHGGLPAALLALVQPEDDPNRFSVSNIIPTAGPRLSRAEYNRLLEDFASRVFAPAAASHLVAFKLTDPTAELTAWMTPATAEKLTRFSREANRETGAARPEDRELWNEFVLAAGREQSRLDAPTLARWLVGVEGWPEVWAEQLAREYEYGRELLGYSSSRGGI
ncbi:MAG: hypothetical protein MUF18_04265 [Fimbriiglobus sp.]|jgi:hypothetical protein|nr:hypothetical protein [Fimbriiglobus sp.]